MDRFADHSPGLSAPARRVWAITPSNTDDFATSESLDVPRFLIIGTQGDVRVLPVDSPDPVTVPAWSGVLPMMVRRVYATGTTATDILGCR